jgi:hypothetical protein
VQHGYEDDRYTHRKERLAPNAAHAEGFTEGESHRQRAASVDETLRAARGRWQAC